MLTDKRVAILVADGFEQVELTEPRKALDEAGARTQIVSTAKDQVQAWKHFDKADHFRVDVPMESADAKDFDALLLPGGVASPDQLRTKTPRQWPLCAPFLISESRLPRFATARGH
jgi:protease I